VINFSERFSDPLLPQGLYRNSPITTPYFSVVIEPPSKPIVRELLVPYSATSRELSGTAKASLRLGLGHPLYAPRACSLLPLPSVRLCTRVLPYSLPYRPLPSTLLCDSCSACLLPTVHPGNMPYTNALSLILTLFKYTIF
jgi:hypothetical protein